MIDLGGIGIVLAKKICLERSCKKEEVVELVCRPGLELVGVILKSTLLIHGKRLMKEKRERLLLRLLKSLGVVMKSKCPLEE